MKKSGSGLNPGPGYGSYSGATSHDNSSPPNYVFYGFLTGFWLDGYTRRADDLWRKL